MNGDVEPVVNIMTIVFVTVTIVRGVTVNPSKADRIAVPAIVERSHDNATPAACTTMHDVPGGFGRNASWRNGRNQADKVAEQRNHGSYKQNVRLKTDLFKLTHRNGFGHEFGASLHARFGSSGDVPVITRYIRFAFEE